MIVQENELDQNEPDTQTTVREPLGTRGVVRVEVARAESRLLAGEGVAKEVSLRATHWVEQRVCRGAQALRQAHKPYGVLFGIIIIFSAYYFCII